MSGSIIKRYKWFFLLLLAFFSIIFTLVILEIIIQIVNFKPKGRAMQPYQFRVSEVPGLYYEYVPNKKLKWKYGPLSLWNRGFTIPVSINSWGLRDDEITIPKPPGTLRILALGDSFTIAMGVKVEDGYVEQLEKLLNQETGNQPHVEVINSGIGGYNTQQEFAFLRAKGFQLEPDMILLGFQVNDVQGQTYHQVNSQGYLMPVSGPPGLQTKLQAVLYDPNRKRSVWEYLLEESHLVRMIASRKLPNMKKNTIVALPTKRDRNEAANALLDIADLADQHGVPLIVPVFPFLTEYDESDLDWQNYDWIQDLCKWKAIPSIPMDQALKGIPLNTLWVHPKDHHPNATAHHRYAKLLKSCIAVRGGKLVITCPIDISPTTPPEGFTRKLPR